MGEALRRQSRGEPDGTVPPAKGSGFLAEGLFPRKANPALPGALAGGKYTGEKSTEVRMTRLMPILMAVEGPEMLG